MGLGHLVLGLGIVALHSQVAWARRTSRYNTGAEREEGKLNVHIVCHSHDDAGWLKTVDQYFYGANNSIQVAGVQYILDTVVQALSANPDRKFVFADMAFFIRWWEEQDRDMQGLVTRLVESGQLDFVNGGYVQHDEATSHYVAMIDQTTRGHKFLAQTFGKVPRVGWQIDPFGHSSTQAGLMSAHLGFDALFFGRADYQDMEYRKGLKALEMVWRGSGSLPDSEVFTSNFFSGLYLPPPGFWWNWLGADAPMMDDPCLEGYNVGNYVPPPGFGWEWGLGDPPMCDDPRLADYNVQERVDTFVRECLEIANVTRGNDIIVPMGSDFWYSNAHVVYKNLDKLLHYLALDGRVNAFYSTPAQYAVAKWSYKEAWPLKAEGDDFYPYADFPHAYWTGYFTSRPTSKGFIRGATSYLQAARQLEAFVGINRTGWTTDALEEAISLTQHHDATTGTEKQHVANDYHRRLHRALKEAQQVALSALSRLVRGEYCRPGPSAPAAALAHGTGSADEEEQEAAQVALLLEALAAEEAEEGAAVSSARRRLQGGPGASGSGGGGGSNPIDVPIHLQACDWLNISACPVTVQLSGAGRGAMVVAYNPLAWGRVAAVKVPVTGGHEWVVQGPEGESIAAQVVPASASTRCLQQVMAGANAICPASLADAEVVFLAELPPTGYNAYFLQPQGPPAAAGPPPEGPAPAAAPASAAPAPPLLVAGSWPASMHGSAQAPAPGPSQHQAGAGAGSAGGVCSGADSVSLDNGVISLEFCCKRGILLSMKTPDAEMQLVTRFAWYNSSDGLETQENRGQASGAYIFRPNGVYDINPGEGRPLSLEILRGDVVSEARQAFNDWTVLVTRLYAGQPYVEFEWTVGPLPHQDGLGREVVVQYVTDLDSGDVFWTDANGREMIKRVRDYRPAWELNVTEPTAGNYYPLTAAMYIQDKERQVALLTDRAQGGASLRSGELEVMLHRRTIVDDWRGVGEPLNETVCGCTGPDCHCTGLVARGVHWLMLSPLDTAARQRRYLQQLLNDPPLLGFAPIPMRPEGLERPGAPSADASAASGDIGLRRSFTLNERGLPKNVHLLTLRDTGEKSFLVRLAHLFQEGEDQLYGLSKPTHVDLNLVMTLFEYQTAQEMSLSTNQPRADALRRLRFKAGDKLGAGAAPRAGTGAGKSGGGAGGAAGVGEGEDEEAELARLRQQAELLDCRAGCRSGPLMVTLGPMEIRTFELVYG